MTSVQTNLPDLPGYRVEAELGRGGMASVFLARKQHTNERVAIKLLLRNYADDIDLQKRFLREAEFVARLDHPNIIRLFDFGTIGEHFFIAMEYVSGGDLRARIVKGLSIEQSLAILRQLADALSAAHSQAITHRDIKPANVLFRHDGSAVLADFGIAKAANHETNLTLTGMVPGTPRYMSPEQARSRPIDGRSDYYSLGILLFEMLTGSAPFVGTDPVSTALMHITEPIPQLDGPEAYLQPLLDRLLVKDPEHRISSSDELRDCIESCQTADATEFIAVDSTEFIKVNRLAALWHKLSDIKYARSGLFMTVFMVTAALAMPSYFNLAQNDEEPEAESRQAAQQDAPQLPQVIALMDKADSKRTQVTLAAERNVVATRVEENVLADSTEDGLFNAVDTEKPLVEMQAKYTAAAPQGENDATPLASLSLFEEPETEQQLDQLYELANAQLAGNQLTRPSGDNALQTFNTMLDIDADDERALNGIAAIVDRYFGLAKQRSDKDIKGAIDLLDRGLQIDAQSKSLLDLRHQLVKELSERPNNLKVEHLLARAEQQIKAGQYARPAGDNAYETLKAAQSHAPKDKRIAQSFDKLLQQVANQARRQQQSENWQAALAYVEDGLRIAPRDAALTARKDKINEVLQQQEKSAAEVVAEEQSEPKKRKRRIIGNF